MKRAIAAILAVVILAGCTQATDFGPCVGLFDDKDPKLAYKMNGWNVFVAVIGASFFFIPTIFVIKDETFCPVARK